MNEEVVLYLLVFGVLCYLVIAILLLSCIRRLERIEENCWKYREEVKAKEGEDGKCS